MTEDLINEMYLLAVRSKLQKNAITRDEKLTCIYSELGNDTTHNAKSAPLSVDATVSLQPKEHVPQTSLLKVIANRYSPGPTEEGFDNMDLDNAADGQYYCIQLTDNPSIALFEFLTNDKVVGEMRMYEDCAPSFAVKFENSSLGHDKLVKVKSGLLEKKGRMWKIIEPCVMKWE